MTTVKATIGSQRYVTEITNGSITLLADEPVSAGGTGAGFNPEEILAAALASCTSITCRMYADRKEMALQKIEVDVSLKRDLATGSTHMERSIQFQGELTDEQRTRLLQIALNCPVHKILSHQVNIKTTIL